MPSKMIYLAGVGALGLSLLFSGCTQPAKPAAPVAQAAAAPTASAAASATATPAPVVAANGALTYAGNVQTKQQVAIVPKVAGRVTKMSVDVGSVVKAGDVILEIDRDSASAQVAQAQAALAGAQAKLASIEAGPRAEAVAQAQANLDIATQRLAVLQKGGRPEQVAQAQANLDSAQSRLSQAKQGATSFDLETARLAVESAKDALYGAQTSRDAACGGAMGGSAPCATAKAQVTIAETALTSAQNRYAQVQAGSTPEQITQAEAAVTAAQEQLKLAQQPATAEDIKQAQDAVNAAQAQLALAKAPTTDFDKQAAQAAVAQAKAALDLANVQLAETTVKAPFDGVVAQKMVAEGAMVGPTSPVVSLISSQNEVVINVDEASFALVKKDQPATVSVTAFPGVEFKAVVTNVAPSLDPKSRTAQVKLSPQDPDGKLHDGMFAQVTLGK